jgi:hypothetical protein
VVAEAGALTLSLCRGSGTHAFTLLPGRVYEVEELDIFRFPEDGRFAFCCKFADWERLHERGYLTF